MMKKLSPLLVLVAIFLIWHITSMCGLVNNFYLPPLTETVAEIFQSFIKGDALFHLWSTLYKTLVGFIIASLLGIFLGIIIGLNKKLYHHLEVVIDFFRSLPATALFPLFLLFFGIGDSAKIAMIVFIAFWIILINTIYGVWNSSKIRKQVGQVFKASYFQILTNITIPDSLPYIFVGLRTALSLSLMVAVVAEMFIGTKFGLGQKIFDSYIAFRVAQLYAFIIIVGIVGYILNKIFVLFEGKIIHWSGK